MAKSWQWRVRIRRALPPRVRKPFDENWHRARRWLRFQRADVCLVSYPKAGRTWLRLLVGRALQERLGLPEHNPMELEDFADHDRSVPRILVTHDGIAPLVRAEELERDKRRYREKSVILLVRDPRDVVVSSYFHATKRDHTYAGSLADYVRDPRGGYETVLTFHAIWRDALHVPLRMLVVRYEDLTTSTAAELARVLDFLGYPTPDEESLEPIVRYARFENMRELEASGALGRGRLEPRNVEDPDSFKVRRGKVGGYRDYLDAESVALVDRKLAAAELDAFGYVTGGI
jgi:hypothetical protein